MRLISFRASSDFAAFRDPSVTTNQCVYRAPTKTGLIGLIGSMVGLERSHGFSEIYESGFRNLLESTKIGIRANSELPKIVFFTNHVSLKEAKTKPFKTELVLNPDYTIFVAGENALMDRLWEALRDNRFKFSPCFGHSYCPVRITEPMKWDNVETLQNAEDKTTDSVVLDESFETDRVTESLEWNPVSSSENSKYLVERHLHPYVEKGKLRNKVLRYWMPIKSKFRLEKIPNGLKLSMFIKIGESDDIVCLF